MLSPLYIYIYINKEKKQRDSQPARECENKNIICRSISVRQNVDQSM